MDIYNLISGRRLPSDGEKEGPRPSPKDDKKDDVFLVDFEPGDGLNPQEWPTGIKIISFAHIVAIGFWVTLAASASSPTYTAVSEDFGVSMQKSELSTSMFLFGFACGSIVLAPLSEEFGRLPVYIVSMAAFGLFEIGAALAPNIATLAITRFLSGLFGTSPLSNAGGSLADIFSPLQLTFFFPFFGLWGFVGPILGPLVGAALTQQYHWRWTYWVLAIVGLFIALSCSLFMRETMAPIILDHKARALRRRTGDKRYRSAHEIALAGKSPFNRQTFERPFVFATTEPIVACFALYLTVVYIVLFADLEAYPLVYSLWNFNLVQEGLAFLPIGFGIVLFLSLTTAHTYRHFRRAETDPSIVLTPETRLFTLLWTCWLIPISLFWMAWTAYASLSPWPSLISGVFFGGGLMQVFIGSYSYIMACYGSKSGSALSVLTFIRYNFSGLAVHAAEPWFNGMGLHWAFSLLGFVSLALCALPFLFYWKGPSIRSHSKFVA